MRRWERITKTQGVVGMGAKRSPLALVKSSSGMRRLRPIFRTDERISESGIYEVIHSKHRLPHEVTLLTDEMFPRCAKCQDAVKFRLVRGVNPDPMECERSSRISLYELPVLDDEGEQDIAV